ncbi:MAG TPA: sugar phosphate isomerase/epimerase family protein [Sediminibacterium sp.]|nr:sugar phosphate isomerase/epimerase family protein [Sediminibacterium sp.]
MPLFNRRHFVQTLALAAAGSGWKPLHARGTAVPLSKQLAQNNRFKISLNAYSFNALLTKNATSLEELIDFCAETGFDAIDTTGYYFPGYPAKPASDYIYRLRLKAHKAGIAISGTGIRNDFGDPDPAKIREQVDFVKEWIDVAVQLGAPVLRVFSAKTLPANHSWEEACDWIAQAFRTCADYGAAKGIIVAMQNHNDFIKTANQAITMMQRVNHPWFGLILDTGSFASEDPYTAIQQTTPWAVNWQIKERLTINGKTADMDLHKLCSIIRDCNYRGYLPIETLSPGDPFTIVPPFYRKVAETLAAVMAEKKD